MAKLYYTTTDGNPVEPFIYNEVDGGDYTRKKYILNDIEITDNRYGAMTLSAPLPYLNGLMFYKCDSLRTVDMSEMALDNPKAVSPSGKYSEMVSLLNSDVTLKQVGAWSFGDCINLESVIFPSTLAYLPDYIFTGCEKLVSVTFKGSTPPKMNPNTAFYGVNPTIFVPSGKIRAYHAVLGFDFNIVESN